MRIILYGGGDLAVEVASYLKDLAASGSTYEMTEIVAAAAPRYEALNHIVGTDLQVHTDLSHVEDISNKKIVICVGDATLRAKLVQQVKVVGGALATVVHPSAHIAPTAIIGEGAVIAPLVFIGPFAELGENCCINVGAVIGHDVSVGASAVVAPGATINGHARLGAASFVGAQAVVHPGKALGRLSKLSSGSVLTQSVGDGFIMHGNPAKGRQMMAVDPAIA